MSKSLIIFFSQKKSPHGMSKILLILYFSIIVGISLRRVPVSIKLDPLPEWEYLSPQELFK